MTALSTDLLLTRLGAKSAEVKLIQPDLGLSSGIAREDRLPRQSVTELVAVDKALSDQICKPNATTATISSAPVRDNR
jgi:hypothetical protein